MTVKEVVCDPASHILGDPKYLLCRIKQLVGNGKNLALTVLSKHS